MNKLRIFLSFVFLKIITLSFVAQAPEAISYQAILRDNNGNLLVSTTVGTQISILQGSITGAPVYEEAHSPTTNINGLVSLEIGRGTIISGNFTLIAWSNGPYYIRTETDLTGGINYTLSSTSELLSVPYALYAKTAETIAGGIIETDPLFTASIAASINNGDTSNWNSKLSSEVDPIFTSSLASTISSFDTMNWNSKLSSEVDGSITNEIQTISRSGLTVSLSNGGSFQDSITEYIAGMGINITNNVISASPDAVSIGLNSNLGGYVFYVTPDGKHGLVADIQDQSAGSTGYTALDKISNASNHSAIGQNYVDWRLPTKHELNLMFQQKNAIGSFTNANYWSGSHSTTSTFGWIQNFGSGGQVSTGKVNSYRVRAIRSF